VRRLLGSLSNLTSMVKREVDPLADPRSALAWMKEFRQQNDVSGQLTGVRELVGTLDQRPARPVRHR
jgi:cyclic-di-GMP-binding protein